jgi:hypothetical protein
MGYNIWTTMSSMKISALQLAAFNNPYNTYKLQLEDSNAVTHLIFLCGLDPIIQILSSLCIIRNGSEMATKLEECHGKSPHNIMIQVSVTLGELIKRIARNVLHGMKGEQGKMGT